MEEKLIEHLQKLTVSSSVMIRKPRMTAWEEMGANAKIRIGDCVEVEHSYAQGFCSAGGIGFVIKKNAALHDGSTGDLLLEECATYGVEYIVEKNIEYNITLTRMTTIPIPYVSSNSRILRSQSTRRSDRLVNSGKSPDGLVRTNLEWLQFGLTTRRHEKKGWLRSILIERDLLMDNKSALWLRVVEDYRCQVSAIEGMKIAMGKNFVDPRETRGVQGTNSGGKFVSLKRSSQAGIPKNVWTIPYLLHAYDVSRTSFQRYRKAGGRALNLDSRSKRDVDRGTVISNRELAKEIYCASFFYVRERIRSNSTPSTIVKYTAKQEYWKKIWDENWQKHSAGEPVQTVIDFERFEFLAREHDARQPFIKEQLVEALESQVTMSFYGLAQHINWWCSPKSIERWLKRFPGYAMYSKNIKPGLSERNREKQVIFAKHVRNRWNLPPDSLILWIHSDEKWFHSLVARRNAKAIPELGIEKESYSAHHKKHIAKVVNLFLFLYYDCVSITVLSFQVMCHATVGYLFSTSPEHGGKGFLIGFHRLIFFSNFT